MSVNNKELIENICESIRNLKKEDLDKAIKKVDFKWKKIKNNSKDVETFDYIEKQKIEDK